MVGSRQVPLGVEGLSTIETHTQETTIAGETITPARRALLAFAKAWTYPILGNEDVPVTKCLFREARALSRDVAASAADPPEFAGWLKVLRDEARDGSNEWEDTLHAVTDYFGLSTGP